MNKQDKELMLKSFLKNRYAEFKEMINDLPDDLTESILANADKLDELNQGFNIGQLVMGCQVLRDDE
jgi:hypothetical protein